MGERKSLAEVKASRPWTPAMQAAYEQAGAAYELGERVRALREEAGLSQRELASRMGTTQSAIARLEAGGAEPTLPTLRRLAGALGRTLVIDFKDEVA
jgi:ribosome-binding protein aMBF1 (putative translation factor)